MRDPWRRPREAFDEMNDKRPFRWNAFSLRTMFVTVTVVCVCLGWELSVVRRRATTLQHLRTLPGVSITTAADWIERHPPGRPVPTAAKVPLVRKWLGDVAIQEIWHTPHIHSPSEAELRQLAIVFPEAEFRESLPIPCHPGCFPSGTPIETPNGLRPIDLLQPGDFVIAVRANGEMKTAQIQSVFVTTNRLWKIDTSDGSLLTTETQPLCFAVNRFVPSGKIEIGSRVLRYDGREIYSATVRAVSPTDRSVKVFNLILSDAEVFIADGFLARCKPPAVE